MQNKIKDFIKKFIPVSAKIYNANMQEMRCLIHDVKNSTNEIYWANVFNSVINKDSKWLLDKSFAPGRWAVSYLGLYIIYNILNEAKPKNILELGSGQSTKMISQYMACYDDANHLIIEENADWLKYFLKENSLPSNSVIKHLPIETTDILNGDMAVTYKNLIETIGDDKYDFILVDGPVPDRIKKHDRIDLLKLIPDNLAPSFCIVFDDFDLSSAANSAELIMNSLEKSRINYESMIYKSHRHILVICSVDMKFICSM